MGGICRGLFALERRIKEIEHNLLFTERRAIYIVNSINIALSVIGIILCSASQLQLIKSNSPHRKHNLYLIDVFFFQVTSLALIIVRVRCHLRTSTHVCEVVQMIFWAFSLLCTLVMGSDIIIIFTSPTTSLNKLAKASWIIEIVQLCIFTITGIIFGVMQKRRRQARIGNESNDE